ncbi:MAG: NAD(P)/FAD-dependent oxidoreductase [Thermodesulfobacteriota bacterium]
MEKSGTLHHTVIVGGGFGGLYAAKELAKSSKVKITLIDKRNFHLFQPLLYQVATGGLSPGDIASPLRSVLNRYKNVTVLRAKVVGIIPDKKEVELKDGRNIQFDSLIISTGVRYNYFSNEKWQEKAPPLKTMEDALGIRNRIFHAFEEAEREVSKEIRSEWLRFIIVGGGPTGVELAGALGELTGHTLKEDFRNFDPMQAEIILVEALDRILPPFSKSSSQKAENQLKKLGVTIRTNTMVTNIKDDEVILKEGDNLIHLRAKTILWAAGVKASKISEILVKKLNVKTDKVGRVYVNPNLTVNDAEDIFVIGDLAHFEHQNGEPLPGLAPVAMQQGKYAAKLIKYRLNGKQSEKFNYFDKGSLAVIGRNKAIAEMWKFGFSGFFAWLIWAFIHIRYLIEFDSKILVMIQWTWNYFTMKRGARLITGDAPFPYMDDDYYSETMKDE